MIAMMEAKIHALVDIYVVVLGMYNNDEVAIHTRYKIKDVSLFVLWKLILVCCMHWALQVGVIMINRWWP
jgi:uncharacterized membrane protein